MSVSHNCTIYAEMHMIFDNDFDVYSIEKIIGLVPTNCKMRKETRISPLTNKQIEGFWTLKTEEKEERDLNIILQELISKISKKLPEIKNLCEKNNGEVIFDIVASFDDNSKPALYFEREFLNVVNYLNASIQIDLYVE